MGLTDARLSLRHLKRRPTFAATVVLTLGIGIGATTGAFAFVRSVFFARLPIRDQTRVVVLWSFNHDVPMDPRWPLTWESRLLVADHSRSFAEVTAVGSYTLNTAARYGEHTFPVARTLVGGNFFDVACTNLAGLLLSRGVERARELVVRTALGATGRQLVTYLLHESAVLGALGGTLGIGLSAVLVRVVAGLAPQDLPALRTAHLDIAVVAFGVAVAVLCVAGFGLLPAVHAAQPDASEVLRGGGRPIGRRVDTLLRRALVGAQVALSLVVLSGAGLLARTLVDLQHTALGFAAAHLVFFQTSMLLPQTALARDSAAVNARWNSFPNRLDQELRRIPGFSDATATLGPAFGGDFPGSTAYVVDGHTPAADGWRITALDEGIDDYFAVMGIPVLRGRAFTHEDDAHAPPVAVVSAAFARRTWPGQDPLGHRIRFRPDTAANRWFTVIGVVGDTRYDEVAAVPKPTIYLPIRQTKDGISWLAVRTHGEPDATVSSLTAAVHAADPDMAISKIETGSDLFRATLARPRALAVLFTGLAATALLLTGIGLFGVLSAYVRERRREIAVRSALGATPSQLRSLVLAQVLGMATAGLACGAPLAYAGSDILRRLVAEVRPVDAWVVGAIGLLLVVAVTLATYAPMAHASRLDPRTALATE